MSDESISGSDPDVDPDLEQEDMEEEEEEEEEDEAMEEDNDGDDEEDLLDENGTEQTVKEETVCWAKMLLLDESQQFPDENRFDKYCEHLCKPDCCESEHEERVIGERGKKWHWDDGYMQKQLTRSALSVLEMYQVHSVTEFVLLAEGREKKNERSQLWFSYTYKSHEAVFNSDLVQHGEDGEWQRSTSTTSSQSEQAEKLLQNQHKSLASEDTKKKRAQKPSHMRRNIR
ncbi:hypothetical protein JD844_012573 [Phrynosoma platyrhinos]|uniref:Uncharacterized protein n=1 Tax=Phrynosoma platyrhinos TaxID=52577 RepID=A0ABQ7TKP5_PHRPL|nr:hypothetical protein JD844_012573 [Phrynosoma platyrhinos]